MESGDQFNSPVNSPVISPAKLAPQVIARTPQWLVLFKPAGWLTIPGRNAPEAPVLSEWADREFGKAWVVHRLDRETSGVVLMALTAEAHRQANIWFQRHEVRKAYDLLAQGSPRAPMLRIKAAIEGSPSVTQVECKERFAGCFLARAVPLTGRRHQIRIHLSGESHPLLGDPTYGGPSQIALSNGRSMPIGRVALHAARLELPSKEVFEAPWPEDFSGWIAELRSKERAHGGK